MKLKIWDIYVTALTWVFFESPETAGPRTKWNSHQKSNFFIFYFIFDDIFEYGTRVLIVSNDCLDTELGSHISEILSFFIWYRQPIIVTITSALFIHNFVAIQVSITVYLFHAFCILDYSEKPLFSSPFFVSFSSSEEEDEEDDEFFLINSSGVDVVGPERRFFSPSSSSFFSSSTYL